MKMKWIDKIKAFLRKRTCKRHHHIYGCCDYIKRDCRECRYTK